MEGILANGFYTYIYIVFYYDDATVDYVEIQYACSSSLPLTGQI